MATNLKMAIDLAKRLQRLQSERRKLRRLLRGTEADIKLARRHLRGLEHGGPDDQLPPDMKERVK